MRYIKFIIENYRAIKGPLEIDLSSRIIPLIGINECGKTTILQAIYCFDHNNDETYEGRHLKNTVNLYSPSKDSIPKIIAEIEIDSELISDIINQKIESIRLTDPDDIQSQEAVAKGIPQKHPKSQAQKDIEYLEQFKENYEGKIRIERSLGEQDFNYSFTSKSNLSYSIQNELSEMIINLLPHIIYTDDFTDRPESEIDITEGKQFSSDWSRIYEKVFQLAGKYTLSETRDQENPLVRKTILSSVKKYLNDVLTESWSRFSPNDQVIEIELEIKQSRDEETQSQLIVGIAERTNGNEAHFDIINRSKGFIWYYNFIMKIKFNPKESGSVKETIFLLDEPGSYLHDKAQEDLCLKLKDISKQEGIVIYCTHSAKLLNPKIIAPNNIQIVEKDKDNNICATPLSSKNDTNSTRTSALQPLYEALEIPEYETIVHNEKVICVEGIYDKYAIECFCQSLPEFIRVFPSTGASSIINNISYFITYRRPYFALWDNDKTGRNESSTAKLHFGDEEAKNFTLLPSMDNGNRRMEEMFTQEDLKNFRTKLNLPDAKYETLMSTIYFHDNNDEKNEIINNLSEEAKNNFLILSNMIQKHFSEKS